MPNDDYDEPEYLRKLFIGNLSFNTTDDSLKEFFEEFGQVVDVVVMKDKQTQRSRGFGFVTFSVSSMVDEVQKKRPHKIDGRVVETKRVVPKDEVGKPESKMQVKKLFIGGIKGDMTEDDLRETFGQFGNVVSASIPKDRQTQKPRSFAFVDFDDCDTVDKVCLHKDIEVKGRRVDIRKAVDKEEMRKQEQRGGGGGGSGGGGGGRGNWGGNQGGGGGGGNWGGNQGGGNWGGNQSSPWGGNQGGGGGGGGSWGGNQGGGSWGGSGGGSWGGNQGGGGGGSGGWGGNQGGGGGGNWGGNSGGGGGWGGNQSSGGSGGGGGWGNQGSSDFGPMRNNQGYGNRSAPYPNSGGGGGGGYGGNQSYGSRY